MVIFISFEVLILKVQVKREVVLSSKATKQLLMSHFHIVIFLILAGKFLLNTLFVKKLNLLTPQLTMTLYTIQIILCIHHIISTIRSKKYNSRNILNTELGIFALGGFKLNLASMQ
jgi:hypothetical protein